MKVATTEGELDHTLLEVRDIAQWGENCRAMATEWYHQGKLVRRDVWVNPLKPVTVGVAHGE